MKRVEKIIDKCPPRKARWGISVLALLFAISAGADSGYFLNIHGTSVAYDKSYKVEDVWKLTFEATDMNVYLVGESDYHFAVPYSEMLKITFGDQAYDAVKAMSISTLGIKYMPASQSIEVKSGEVIRQLYLYNMQGHLLQRVSPGIDHCTLQLEGYPSGIYIVRAESGEQAETKKIIK